MKKILRLAGSLILVFIISFFLSGGKLPFGTDNITTLTNKVTKTENPLPTINVAEIKQELPTVSQESLIENTEETIGFFKRAGRFIMLKQAVADKLHRANYITIDRIPDVMRKAIISVEDNRFYSHYGFDPTGIARAALVNIQYGEIEEGASTITQQLVKNLFLSHERSLDRKIEEFFLALDMEARYSKDEILELYLNTIYFGSGYYGIADASAGYFGKSPDKLTLPEAAMLAGLPNAPSLYSPYEDFKMAKKRQFIVLDTMVKNGYINNELAESAKLAPIYLAH